MAITVIKAPGNITSNGSITTAKLVVCFTEVYFIPTAKKFVFSSGKSITSIEIYPPVINPTGYTDVDYIFSIIKPQFDLALDEWYDISFTNDNADVCYLTITAKEPGAAYNISLDSFPTELENLENNSEWANVSIFSVDTVNTEVIAVGVLNPVEYVLQTNTLYSSTGAKEKIKLQFLANQANGALLVFEVLGKTITFTFKSAGTIFPNNIATQPIGFSISQWVQSRILPQLLNNYILATSFSISATDDYIILEALNTGSKYNLIVTPPNSNIVVTSIANGADIVRRPNFEILLDVYFENEYLTDNYQLSYSAIGVPTSNQQCRFNISKALTALIKPALVVPTISQLNSSMVFTCKSAFRYFLRYAELYGEPQQADVYSYFAAKSIITAIYGGSKLLNYQEEQLVSEFFNANIVKWLTAMPNGIEVNPEQSQLLSFYFNRGLSSESTLKRMIKLYYIDGTFSDDIEVDTFTVTGSKVLTVPVGYNQLSINTLVDEEKVLTKYSVWIANTSDEPITEPFSFSINSDYFNVNKYFLFLNSYGMPEVIWFTGNKVESMQHNSQVVQRIHYRDMHENTGIYEGSLTEERHDVEPEFEINTGYKNKSWVMYAQEFLSSTLRYEIMPNKLAQVIIDKAKVRTFEDNDTEFAFKFSYTYGWREEGMA